MITMIMAMRVVALRTAAGCAMIVAVRVSAGRHSKNPSLPQLHET